MPMQSADAVVGLSVQANKSTARTTIDHMFGITDGSVMTVEVSQDLEARTSGRRFAPSVNRTAVMPGIDFTCRAHPGSVGMLLWGALGAYTTAGASAPYTHEFTLGDDLPYFTTFAEFDGDNETVRAVKIDSLELSWNENEPVEVAVSGMGCDLILEDFAPWDAFVGTGDTFATYFRPAGGLFRVDVDGASAVAAEITGGSISINNNLTPVMVSGSLTPDSQQPGQQSVEVTLETTPSNLNDWRAILTGSPNGSAISDAPVYGSLYLQFTDGTYTMTIVANRVAFTTEFPSADAGGGPATLTLAGMVVLAADGTGSPLTVEVTNGVQYD